MRDDRVMLRSVLLMLVVLVVAMQPSVAAGPSAQSAGPGLFVTPSAPGTLDRSIRETIERVRFVGVDLTQLVAADGSPQSPQPGSTLLLNLFEDIAYTAALERVEANPEGGFTWLGKLEGLVLSQVTLVVNEGVLVGNVTSPEGFFQVRYAGEGIHAVYQIDQGAFPPEKEPVPVPLEQNQVSAAEGPTSDDGSIIDVLVVYTDDARAAAGGTTAIRNAITLAMAETNTSYGNSQIVQRLNLAHTAEVSYPETGDVSTDLGRLRMNGDGYLDSVHGLRDTYAADEVVLVVENGGSYCGIAYMMDSVSVGFAPWAFAVVDRGCATGYYSFAHELGHNMGARHDRYVDTNTTPYPYSHGYVNAPDRWRTIMAYNAACADQGFNCTRLQYWSNPGRTYGGDPMGSANADNHLTLNNTRITVANFRVRAQPPNPPSALSATAISQTRIDLAWVDNSTDESGFKIERSLSGTSGWSQIAIVSANSTVYANNGLSAGITYYYRVRAYTAQGDSAYSNVADATTYIVGPLVYGGHVVDDDSFGESLGNADGRIQCGERVELLVDLRNKGSLTAAGITANISTSDPYVTWLYNTSSDYSDVASGAIGRNTNDFELEVAPDTPHAHPIRFDLVSTASNGGPWSESFEVRVFCADEFVFLPQISRAMATGFDSQFNGSSSGWLVHSGEWWIEGGEWFTTNGVPQGWASSSYDRDFADMDFEARFWRAGCDTCANRLMVRGTADPLGSGYAWDSYYAFQYSRTGSYSIWKSVAGTSTPLQGWTTSASVHQGSAWNVLRVVARGPNLYFYINGTLVWTGFDSELAVGRVGMGIYSSADTSTERLWVDWATLSPPGSTDGQEVSLEQQVLNDTAKGQGRDSEERAPARE